MILLSTCHSVDSEASGRYNGGENFPAAALEELTDSNLSARYHWSG